MDPGGMGPKVVRAGRCGQSAIGGMDPGAMPPTQSHVLCATQVSRGCSGGCIWGIFAHRHAAEGVYLNGSVLKAISDEAKDDEKRASVWRASVMYAQIIEREACLVDWSQMCTFPGIQQTMIVMWFFTLLEDKKSHQVYW